MKRKFEKKGTLFQEIFAKKVITWLVVLLSMSLIFTGIPVGQSSSASSTMWYVVTTGSDAAVGDISHPFRTIQHAVDVAQAGETILVRGGTYNEILTMKRSGTSGSPITIAGALGESAIIDGTGKSSPNGLIYLNGKDYITFTNLKIQNSATHGLYTGWSSGTNPSTDITVTYCDFKNMFYYAILFYASNKAYPCYRMNVNHCMFDNIEYAYHSSGTTQECVGFGGCIDSEFSYNTMTHIHKIGFDFGTCKNVAAHHNDIDVTDMSKEAFGIYVIGGHAAGYECTDIQIYNNYLHGNRQCIGIGNENAAGSGSRRVSIYNNIIVPTGSYAGILMFNQVSGCYFSDIQIYHNTIYAPSSAKCIATASVSTSDVSGFYIANNIAYGGSISVISTAVKTNNLDTNPLFTNQESGNDLYHLQSDSPARDAASSTYSTLYDFDGKNRTSPYDIGAYEYDGTDSGDSTPSMIQQQTQYNNNKAIYSTRWNGQSFIPTTTTLNQVDVYISRYGNPTSAVVLSIRSSINGADLESVSKSASEIPTRNGWVEFDFDGLTVTPGTTYYLVLKTPNGNYRNCYYWGYGLKTPYTDGEMWRSSTGGSSWTQYTFYDFCFKTYGYS